MVSRAKSTVVFLGRAALLGSALLTSGFAMAAPAQRQTTISILQPLDAAGTSTIAVGGTGFNDLPVVRYFELAVAWIQVTAVGFCVLWVVISGVQIMVSAGGSGLESAKDHMKWGIIGLLMLFFMGFILSSLNSMFYT